MGVNLDGVVFGTHAALPALRARGGGAIVATASLAGLTGVAYDPLYAANKHAVVGLTRSLGPQLAAEGIRFNAICPGFAESAMIEPIRDMIAASGVAIIAPEQVAAAVVELFAGDAAGDVRRDPARAATRCRSRSAACPARARRRGHCAAPPSAHRVGVTYPLKEGCTRMRKLRILLCIVVPAWALGAFLPASAPAAVDMFLQADGLLGESQSDKYKDAIDVLAFSWGASSSAAGKANFQDISVTKYVDRTSPTLLTQLATGRVIARAKLTVVRAGEVPAPYLRYCFTGLRVTSLSNGGSGGEDRLTENVSFSYSTIVEAYQQVGAKGELGPAVFGGWDLLNKLQFGDQTC